MIDNPNEVTVDNSVLILIDHQPWVAFAVNSIDPSLLSNNLEGLASSAKALDMPVILTTVGAEGGKLRDPLMRVMGGLRGLRRQDQRRAGLLRPEPVQQPDPIRLSSFSVPQYAPRGMARRTVGPR